MAERKAGFVEAIHQYERVRRRDGASEWGIFYDAEAGDRYLEVFLVSSWAEHQRQHERQTQADHQLEQRLRSYIATDSMGQAPKRLHCHLSRSARS